jgi:lipopolysaccharide export system protein LptA
MSKDLSEQLRLGLAAVAFLLVGAASLPAWAERADREKPIHLEADRVTIDDAKKISVFEGNVILTQGTLVIRADRMIVREDQQGFNHGTAFGNLAKFRQKRDGVDEYVEGEAERIEYDGKAERLQLFNRAQMKRGADEVRGSYISYDQPTEFFRVIGAAENATAGSPPGRVRAVIQPKSKDAKPEPAAPPVKLKPSPSVSDPRK